MTEKPISQHNTEIALNAEYWKKKPLLQKIYTTFYGEIAAALNSKTGKGVLEIGSGIGAIKTVMPDCITSDVFKNPWLDRVENAYRLSFADHTLDGIILFDVWHHLRFPGVALAEFARVLRPGGRVVLFEPAMGLLGRIVYGLFHHEPLGLGEPITWTPPPGSPLVEDYYAAQGNAWRTFYTGTSPLPADAPFTVESVQVFAALSYVASGGFSKRQIYPTTCYNSLCLIDRRLNAAPKLFATRMLVTLSKEPQGKLQGISKKL